MNSDRTRTILFLQGPPSTFWLELARGFERHGHKTVKINVCFGDMYFWRRRGAYHFRGSFKSWSAYVEKVIVDEGVTDIVYFADRQPYHVEAQTVARKYGIRCYAVEFGYLRPGWLTLERGGMGTYSHFPSDPELIHQLAENLPEARRNTTRFQHVFAQEAYGEVAFHLFSEFLRPLYPFYKSDRYYHAFHDYLSWLVQLVREPWQKRRSAAVLAELEASRAPYFLLALQLQSDYQIRANSPYRHIREMLDEVIGSFAANGRPEDHLVIKQHPLDNGWENWVKVVGRIAARHGVTDRIHAIETGPLAQLITGSRGTIVINSTVGLHALNAKCPTKVLGIAVFDIAGLTDQQPLADFWQQPQIPDARLLADFNRLLSHSVQVRGSFYNALGRRAAVAEIVKRVQLNLVNEPGAYVEILPRLERARRLGVPVSKAAAPLAVTEEDDEFASLVNTPVDQT